MCRFRSSLILALLLVVAGLSTAVQAEEGDTLSIDREGGSVKITFDEHGLSVEESADTASSAGRIIFDNQRPARGPYDLPNYRERGTDVVKFGEDVFIGSGDLVRGDIVVFGGDVVIQGKVVGNVVVMAGDASVHSGAEVSGDVVVLGGTLEEEDNVVIHGERVMMKDLSIPIQGVSQFFGSHARFFGFFFVPIQFFISIILSYLIILFMKDRVTNMQNHVQLSFLKSFGAGFLAIFGGVFLVSLLTIILVITIIGIPLAFILIVSCIAVFIIARTAFVYALGVKIAEKLNAQTGNPFAVVLVGTAALYLPALLGYALSVLPYGDPIGAILKGVGGLISMFAYVVGIGAIFLSRFGVRAAQPDAVAAAPAPAPQPE